jgi:hypothetical protein
MKYKIVPLLAGQAQGVLSKLSFPDFVTIAQDGGSLSALNTGRLYRSK